MKTAEEIKEKFASICKETCEGYQHEDILKAMEEYAEQFKQPSLDKQITDEMIEKQRSFLQRYEIYLSVMDKNNSGESYEDIIEEFLKNYC